MDISKIAHCVETLCNKGCKTVSLTILALEREDAMEEVKNLDKSEREAVLAELKSIMAVYQEGDTCG